MVQCDKASFHACAVVRSIFVWCCFGKGSWQQIFLFGYMVVAILFGVVSRDVLHHCEVVLNRIRSVIIKCDSFLWSDNKNEPNCIINYFRVPLMQIAT